MLESVKDAKYIIQDKCLFYHHINLMKKKLLEHFSSKSNVM